jgi:hypothetical protein
VIESYQLNNPGIERVIDLVRAFGKTNRKKKVEASVMFFPLGTRNLAPLQIPAGP